MCNRLTVVEPDVGDGEPAPPHHRSAGVGDSDSAGQDFRETGRICCCGDEAGHALDDLLWQSPGVGDDNRCRSGGVRLQRHPAEGIGP
ncbi:MAG: hypothetical protein QOJ11_2752 [Frankiales bacterium]|jgi:hypothetical protein|nr:hypothetical protein [Frankiales bacterium]